MLSLLPRQYLSDLWWCKNFGHTSHPMLLCLLINRAHGPISEALAMPTRARSGSRFKQLGHFEEHVVISVHQ
jgi:hypothetical protein